ncbi:MAG: phosphate ABC transporter ATP-binding protein [Ardenticatenaceae bacterium]|nr:phosphate ABC transporter ATP-binding protein [Ardenticatenaceae bacterium]
MTPLYTLENITQTYNGRTVLDISHLTIARGEVLAVVGPSGAGKSTLLRLLAFLEQPTNGRLTYQNRVSDGRWPDLEMRRHISMVFQRPQLLRRSVQDNVAYGLYLRGQQDEGERITAVLQQLGLGDLHRAAAHTLSGGEMQRVALARALVLHPEVLLLDEPTANLDPYNIKLIEQIVLQANQEMNSTVVMVTHNIFQARRLAQRVALLLNGRLVEVADADTFFEAPQQTETAAFVRGDIIY